MTASEMSPLCQRFARHHYPTVVVLHSGDGRPYVVPRYDASTPQPVVIYPRKQIGPHES